MRFTLHYSGPLPPNGDAAIKQQIRRRLHSQLKQVWLEHPLLRTYAERKMALPEGTLTGLAVATDGRFAGAYPWQHNMCRVLLCGFELVPLVLAENFVSCHLRIKFLRRGRPGDVTKGGDLDNRLKTLLDALRIPHREDELGGDRPSAEGERLYCLLADDSLITEISVDADQLLEPPSQTAAVLYIEVTLTPYLF